MRSRHVSTVIRRPPEEVYALAGDPERLPAWAAGLAAGEVRADGDALVVDSPMGEVRVRFAPRNPLGVLDHEVTLPDGTTTYNPLRVLPHPLGSEVVFAVRDAAGDEDGFEQDAAAVAEDLERLRAMIEGPTAPGHESPARPAVESRTRPATPADAAALGRLLYDFNTEFDAQTPDAATLAGRFASLLGREDVLAVLAVRSGDIGQGIPSGDAGVGAGGDAGAAPAGDSGVGAADEPEVGFALLTLRPTPMWDGPLAQLEELYVRPDLRGGGIGTELLTRALDEVRARGAAEMLINVDADDTGARRFYERHGFSDRDPDTGCGMRCYLRQV